MGLEMITFNNDIFISFINKLFVAIRYPLRKKIRVGNGAHLDVFYLSYTAYP